jgi:hypothetical protein
MFACTVHDVSQAILHEASHVGGFTSQETLQRFAQSASQSVWQSAPTQEVMQLALQEVVQLPSQSMLPGVQLPMQLASQPPVQVTSGAAVHSPSHAATKLSGVHIAVQPPETSKLHMPLAMSWAFLQDAALGVASAADDTSIRGAAKRPTRNREMDRRMALFS